MCSSPMGSFEITDTPWEEWLRENDICEINDAWGTCCEPSGRIEETGRSPFRGDYIRRHELHGRTWNREGEMESGVDDPLSGYRIPEKHPRPLLQCDSPSWDIEDLYN